MDAERDSSREPQARYAYYRRCQVFRKNGEQCKAPAEKGSCICYAHAGERRTALRRKIELAVLLAEVVRRMRLRGRVEFEIGDIFMDFNAIQVTLGVMAQALIDGRIDCKTAGRLVIGLQTAAKLLRLVEKKQTTKDTKRHEERKAAVAEPVREEREEKGAESGTEIGIHLIPLQVDRQGPPYWARAA